jgi:hypothetical protein
MMNIKKTVSASITTTTTTTAVVLAMLFVASGFFGISQRMAFATSDDDEEDKCMDAAKKISDDADGHASSNVCEIGLARGSPTIKLLGHEANDLTTSEFKYQKASASGSDKVLFIAEVQLLQDEVHSVEKSLIDKDWEVTAIHNHELNEDPLMIFLHAQKSDNLDQLLHDIRDVLKYDTDCDCIT